MFRINVMSRFQAGRLVYPLQEKTGIISIYGALQEPLEFRQDPNLVAVLRLQFDDVDKDEENCMTQEHAGQILNFLNQCGRDMEKLIIHCNFGACRSAAIAAAIMKAATGDDAAVFDSDGLVPNMHCYRLTLEALLDEDGKSRLNPEIRCEFAERKWT